MSDTNDVNDQTDEQDEQTEKPDAPEERNSYLTRSTMLPIEGIVYCLDHTAVHDDTTDLYRTGSDECRKEEHRTVYYRAHKGDYDERQPSDGSGAVKHRIVTGASGDGLSPEERELVVRLVQRCKHTALRATSELRQLFGEEDRSMEGWNDRLARLDSILDKLDEADDRDGD